MKNQVNMPVAIAVIAVFLVAAVSIGIFMVSRNTEQKPPEKLAPNRVAGSVGGAGSMMKPDSSGQPKLGGAVMPAPPPQHGMAPPSPEMRQTMMSGAVRPGGMNPGMMPPGGMPPGGMRPGGMGMRPGMRPPGGMPPGGMPPGAQPPATPNPPAAGSSETNNPAGEKQPGN